MKKLIKNLLVCSLMLAAVGCSKENIIEPDDSEVPFPLEVSVPVPATKATDTQNEDKVNSLQVFIFRSNGVLESYGKSTSSSATAECTSGSKVIVAIANAPDITDVTTKSAIEKKISGLKENSKASFVMYGTLSTSVTAASGKISVPVTRLVARISIQKITNKLSLPQFANTPIQIRKIYLLNAAGNMQYGDAKYEVDQAPGSFVPTVWYNKGSYVSTDLPALLSSGDLSSASATKAAPYSTAHYFYCYPNPSTEDTSSGKPGYTRLVVEASIGGAVCYYPINIKGILNNHTYNIKELIITRVGSENPNTPVTASQATFTVTVNPWQDGTDESVTI